MRLTLEDKLKCVKLHLEKGVTIEKIQSEYGLSKSTLKYDCALYLRYGERAFKQTDEGRRIYTRKEKLEAIRKVLSNESTCRQIAQDYMLTEPKTISDWVHLFKTKGEQAIKDTYSRDAYKTHDKSVLEKEYKKLLKDLEETKAENDFLKKSFPLVLKRSKQLKKK